MLSVSEPLGLDYADKIYLYDYHIGKAFEGKNFHFWSSCLLENFRSSMLLDLHCQFTRPYFVGKDLRLSEKPRKFFPLKCFAVYGNTNHMHQIHSNHMSELGTFKLLKLILPDSLILYKYSDFNIAI